MEEQWKDIIIEKNGIIYDYTGLYQVSNLGRVKSLDRIDASGHRRKGKIMKLKPRKDGYVYATLCKDGEKQQFTVHRLVATTFIPNSENLPVVNHKNETKTDNVWTNLEWCTEEYNANYGTRNERLSEAKKGKNVGAENPRAHSVICLETKQSFNTIKEAQEWLGKGNIKSCCRGGAKTAGKHPITKKPLHWMYLDDYKRQLRMQSDINNSRLAA